MKPDKTILIVEDSPTQLELLRHILDRNGRHVIPAQDGRQALDLIEKRKPALVISDVLMPEMNGFELCRRMKQNATLRLIPIILVTSLADATDVLQGLECGADNFIIKPFDEASLLTSIETVESNWHLAEAEAPPDPLRIVHGGREYSIRSGRLQVLQLLLSTYEAAVRKNRELMSIQQDLESKVQERTLELEESVQSVESLCYTIAHDLRAPLRAMQGFTTALLEDYSAALDDTGQDYAQRISTAASRMDRLIQDLLAYGRLSHTEAPLEPVGLQGAVTKALRRFDPEIRQTQAKINVHTPLPSVRANPVLLEQVLFNLIENALKFVAPNVPPLIEISAVETGGVVRLSIRDNGIGFPSNHKERIFDIFERLHNTQTYSGTGIGLSIVRKAVERMNGRVGAESEPNNGSTFWIELEKNEPRAHGRRRSAGTSGMASSPN